MATIDQAVYTRATSYAGLLALIGTRCYPAVALQGSTPPYLVYHKISSVLRPRTMGKRAQIVWDRFQIDCYTETKAEALALRTQVINAFDHPWTGASPDVVDSFLVGDVDTTELIDTNTQLRRISLDFQIGYRNPEYV